MFCEYYYNEFIKRLSLLIPLVDVNRTGKQEILYSIDNHNQQLSIDPRQASRHIYDFCKFTMDCNKNG